MECLLVWQPAQQINLKHYVSHTYYFILGLRLGLGLILYCFAELAAGPLGVAFEV